VTGAAESGIDYIVEPTKFAQMKQLCCQSFDQKADEQCDEFHSPE
jgi:hypothetical protein